MSAFIETIETGKIMDKNGNPFTRPFQGYLLAKIKYYAGNPIISDALFDRLEDTIRKHFPDCPCLQVVGTPTKEDIQTLHNWLWNIKAKFRSTDES